MNFSIKFLFGLLLLSFMVGLFFPQWLPLTGLVSAPSSSVSFSGIQSAFCPSLSCESIPIQFLNNAHSRVWIAMYSFTNQNLADAVMAAHKRGLDVRVIVEKQQAGSQFSLHDELAEKGIPVRIDTNPNLMHHKFAVVDNDGVITGSMNWTGNGVSGNNENVLVIHSNELNSQFEKEFVSLWEKFSP
ncbi:MAG: phospholipase D family protein [Candidatus Diapherotrites archaeon]